MSGPWSRRLVTAALVVPALALTGATPANASSPRGSARDVAQGAVSASPGSAARPRLRIPALGIDRRIYSWGCRGGRIPDRVWSWGCSGRNNLYLLGHAWGVFKPLKRARERGALAVGMRALVTDRSGVTRRFRLIWSRVVPWQDLGTNSAGPGRRWAWNATKQRVVTLQTCYGKNSSHRLIVRFVLEV